MTPDVFEQLREEIRRQPRPLSRLHASIRDSGSRWSVEQLRLFLECMAGVEVEAGDRPDPKVSLGERTVRDELADAIAEAVRSQGGKPVPAAAVLRLLPGRFTTSVEQIVGIARQTPGLEVFGPNLIRLRS